VCCSLWYNAPTMLLAGNLDEVDEEEHSLMLLRIGEIIARNMLS